MNYIIFDLEATCEKDNKNFTNEIIEIGAVKVSDGYEIVDEFTSFVKPILNPVLTDFCMNLTTIKQSDIDSAPLFKDALASFQEWIGNDTYWLCSWGFYDKAQLKKDCQLHRVDTNWLINHISLKHQHGKKVIGKEKGVGMQAALNKAGLKLEGIHHRGIDDAKNIAQIFIKYRDIWVYS